MKFLSYNILDGGVGREVALAAVIEGAAAGRSWVVYDAPARDASDHFPVCVDLV